MVKRIIFLLEATFNLRDYRRFGIDVLRKNQFVVEIWDLTPALHPDIYATYSPPDKAEDDGLVMFHDIAELRGRLASLRNTDFIVNFISFSYGSQRLDIYRALSRSGADYAVLTANALPGTASLKPASMFERIRGLFPITLEKILIRIFVRIPFALLGVKPAKLILAGGENCLKNYHYPMDSKTEVLWAHALDYDVYLEERGADPSKDGDKIVFLDEYLPFHPDWKYYNLDFPMNAERYYALLDKLFRKIEKELKMEVVIAAHPRSDYKESDDYFKGRRCIRGKSCSLVKESRLVISHASTSINFAVLFYKPVLFVTAQQLDKCWEGPLIRSMAQWLEKEPVFMDEDRPVDWQKEMQVNKKRYDNYRRSYIKRDGFTELPFWQIVADRLKVLQ